MPNLIIKLNDNPLPNDCPLCGAETNANIGAELFLADTESIVCIECGSKHAPILAAMISFGDFARLFNQCGESIGKQMKTYFDLSKLFCEAEKRFGDNWTDKRNVENNSINSYQSFCSEARNG